MERGFLNESVNEYGGTRVKPNSCAASLSELLNDGKSGEFLNHINAFFNSTHRNLIQSDVAKYKEYQWISKLSRLIDLPCFRLYFGAAA